MNYADELNLVRNLALEAGGKVTDLYGNTLHDGLPIVGAVAGSSQSHQKLFKLLEVS